MRLILEKEQKQKEKRILDAMEYDECVVEYIDEDDDAESMLIVVDDTSENVIVFWRLSVYAYSVMGKKPIQEVYELIKLDFDMKKILDIYPVSSTITFERVKE